MTEENLTPQETAPEENSEMREEYDFETPEMKAKVEKLKAALNLKAAEEPEITPEAVMARKMAEATPEKPITGADIDWTDYELDPQIAHLYPRAILKVDNEVPQWISFLDEFLTTSRNLDGQGRLNSKGEPLNAGEYASWMVNGGEGWRLVAFLPSGAGMVGIVFQRRNPVNLPTPTMIRTETEVAPLTDEELKNAEEAGVAWAAEDDEDVAAAKAAMEEEERSWESVQADLARKAGENPVFAKAASDALAAIEGADYAEPEHTDSGSEEK